MGAQTELHAEARGRVMAMDSAYDVAPANRGRDVVINASYCGVLPARFIAEQRPRGAIGVDCGVGPAGASIAGLWYLEALQIPAAVADVMTVKLGDGVDLHHEAPAGAEDGGTGLHACASCALCHSAVAVDALLAPLVALQLAEARGLLPARDTGRLLVATLERPPRR